MGDLHHVAFAVLDFDRNHFTVKLARRPRGRTAVVGFQCERILLLAAVVVFFGAEVGAHAHHLLVVHVEQSVLGQAVDQGGVAKLGSEPAAGQVVRNLRHVLHSARHDHVGFTQRNGLGSQGDRLHARRADLVDGGTRNRIRQTCAQCRLTSRSLSDVGLQHAAHQHFVNFVRIKANMSKGAADGSCSKFRGRNRTQGTHKASDRGPHGGHNNYVFHHQKVVLRRYCQTMLNHLLCLYLQPFSQGLTALDLKPGEVGERLKPVVC